MANIKPHLSLDIGKHFRHIVFKGPNFYFCLCEIKCYNAEMFRRTREKWSEDSSDDENFPLSRYWAKHRPSYKNSKTAKVRNSHLAPK